MKKLHNFKSITIRFRGKRHTNDVWIHHAMALTVLTVWRPKLDINAVLTQISRENGWSLVVENLHFN